MAGPLVLQSEIVILCEGAADRNFLDALKETRTDLPPVQFLPPDTFWGNTNFDKMLTALKGDALGFRRLKGVLIIADNSKGPKETFEDIRKQIGAAGYPEPGRLMEISPQKPNHPFVAVTLLPDDNSPGCLETLFARAVLATNPWVERCVDSFLRCDRIEAHGWGPEKLAKAKYHSMVAALHRDDPSRSASTAFTSRPPVMPIASPVFSDVADRIKTFCDAIGA